jgi:N-acetylneuraminate synthase|tara:strand:- start:478 stop:1314 length:837 start_codon:yes stop_codon:yes gene_type:complete
MSIFIIGEIGINHNGDIEQAKKLILGAKDAGADAVKFQKRTIDLVYTKESLKSLRESPWGKTFGDQKRGLEFGDKEYNEIDKLCKDIKIKWFASCWDIESLNFLKKYNCPYNKIASPMLTNYELIDEVAKEGKYTFISTGMHTIEEIEKVVNIFKQHKCPFELMHAVSTYPMQIKDANLKMIDALKKKFKCNVGYSGHEVGRSVSVAAAALGASSLERHITLDRTNYGSDQAASLEIAGFKLTINYIRNVEMAMGTGEKIILEEEKKIRKKLAPIKNK